MFITVMFGAGCWELVNIWCSLGTLTAHLRQRCKVPPDGEGAARGAGGPAEGPPPWQGKYHPCPASLSTLSATIALLAEDGHLVNLVEGLEEGPSPAPPMQERGTYVLVQIIKGEGGDPTRYESLLENLDGWCPEMAGECHRRAWGWGRLPAHALKQGILGLTEELRWRSGLPPQGDGRRRRLGTQRGHQEQGPPSRPRRVGSLLSWTQEPGPGARPRDLAHHSQVAELD
ncbi:uncharacterized protein C22orf15 homolog isoform X2 [Cervus canadensis]|uniref:uncharacterized protein C22orf15 homolog isoform X2 n=1 Tax=Cervus canadensis TaxID=1574408 RepID=UPI001C9E9192|nr:uncharacterized protein C22orf15 homolog isoform X2 [Cervus canadensis]